MSPTFRSLSHPNYRRYAAGSLVSNTGTWMQRVAQDWLVLLLTGSGAAIGITTGLQFLPFLLLSPWAGLVADRIPKRRLLQLTNIGMAVPALVLGLLAVTGTAQIWHVYVLALVLGVASAFDAPARQSFVSEIVGPDDLANAVGLNSASFNTARLVGPALAGLLIAGFGGGVGGTGWVILLNGLSYAAPVLTLRALDASLLRTPEPSVRRPGQVREGVAYVRGRPDLLLLLGIVFSAGTFGLNFQMTSALMATEVFDKGPTEYGLRVRVRHRLVVGAALAFGAIEVVAGLAPSYVVFALLCPLLGLSALTMITSANTHLQLSTAPEMRGRVMALYMMIFIGGTPLGAPFIGWVGETFGARWTLVVGGVLTVLGTLLASVAFLGGRRVLTGLRAPGSLVPRVWDNQAVARARK